MSLLNRMFRVEDDDFTRDSQGNIILYRATDNDKEVWVDRSGEKTELPNVQIVQPFHTI